MTRHLTAWLCLNCGKPLQQTNTSRRRREFTHRDKAGACPGIKPISVREYRADLRAIAAFLTTGMLDRIGEPKPCLSIARNVTEREQWDRSMRLLACQIPVIIAAEPAR